MNHEIVETEKGLFAILTEAAALNLFKADEIFTQSHLQPIDFSTPAIGALWRLVGETIRAGLPLDVVAIGNRALAIKEIQAAGGQKFITEWLMPTAFPSREIAGEYSKTILESSLRRRASSVFVDAYKSLKKLDLNCLDVLKDVVENLQGMSNRVPDIRIGTGELETLMHQLEEAMAGRNALCIPTGIVSLDNIIGGLQASVLTMIGAYPGVGKSALLASIAYSLCQRNFKVGFFSLEDEGPWIARRWLASKSGVSLFNLQTGKLNSWDLDALSKIESETYSVLQNLILDDRPSLSISEIISSAKDMILSHKAQVIILDHLGEVRLERSERYDLDVADALSELRKLAKKHKIPVVVASHVRRRQGLTVEDAPALTDFANSSAPERMARVALGLSKHEKGIVCTVLKQTNGPSGESIGLKLFEKAAMVVPNGEFAI